MEHIMMENGSMTRSTEKEHFFYQMGKNMKKNGKTEGWSMEKYQNIKLEQYMMEKRIQIWNMEKKNKFGWMEQNMKENGRMVKNME